MIEIKEELLDIDNIRYSKKPMLDLFIRRTAVITQTDESITDKIIRDQWKNASKAVSTYTDICEVDFTNLGIFEMSTSKARKRTIKINNCINTLERRGEDLDPKIEKTRVLSIHKYHLLRDAIQLKQKTREVYIKNKSKVKTNEVKD
jgi:hypothetical protein